MGEGQRRRRRGRGRKTRVGEEEDIGIKLVRKLNMYKPLNVAAHNKAHCLIEKL